MPLSVRIYRAKSYIRPSKLYSMHNRDPILSKNDILTEYSLTNKVKLNDNITYDQLLHLINNNIDLLFDSESYPKIGDIIEIVPFKKIYIMDYPIHQVTNFSSFNMNT